MTFIERPHENEKSRALTYVSKLLEEAINSKENRAEDIKELEDIQKLLSQKKYGLVWEQHAEKFEEDMKFNIPVFVENKSKKFHNDNNSSKFNFLLEGDNLHSLHLLEKTHLEKIDIIYIDPPYNTGNKDFVYNDDFVDNTDEFKHSKWLSFMERRLKIANMLIKNDGIIFISIGDEEFAQLKLLCDEIFGLNSFRENIMVEISSTTGMKVATAKKGGIVKNGEYILVYSKSDLVSTNRKPLYDFVPGFDTHFTLFLSNEGVISKTVDVIKSTSEIVSEFDRLKSDNEKLNLKTFSKYLNQSSIFMDFVIENIKSFARLRTEVPTIPNEIHKSLEEGKWVEWTSLKREEPYYLTLYNGEIANLATMESTYHNTDDFKSIYGRSIIRGDFWKNFWIDMGNIGKEGGVSFKNGKKPIRLIKQLLKWANRPEGIVLDFFAGSGTTGDAVSQMNNENSSYNQNFILSTNDEVIDTTYQRMKYINHKTPLNLKYFKTELIDKQSDDLENRLLNNVKTLIELKHGIDLDDSAVAIITKRSDMKDLDVSELTTIYMRSQTHKMLDRKQLEELKGITIIDIPETFFPLEMKGAGL
ncbi:site-specific DNA-methyltransferase [Leuconostoc mesenteroides]|uniref:site-specific DNA-methyltransferase n=2 Tax=Leuconostoc mesenteroides TaxID=1245 RepID=UPI001CBC8172|nr:site-specific DNA-methyltransferase [Leuconostoc mesenteroides]MBZ1541293.1 site-specific DNA-methyltransferase [Leuconostoc mesenteroides]